VSLLHVIYFHYVTHRREPMHPAAHPAIARTLG